MAVAVFFPTIFYVSYPNLYNNSPPTEGIVNVRSVLSV